MTTPTKPVFKFPWNQCVACHKKIRDQCHPILLFGQAGKDMPGKFESVTGTMLNASDSFPKKACVPCKNKLESTSEFKKMEQELMLQGKIKWDEGLC